jgi:2-polyprenyl-6-hydroxyphenyl methylase/3-demethylubiquinone-9 3-methyltransferase
MEVNNEIYETLGHLWWSEDAGFELTSLRFCMNPVRYGYFQRILGELAIAGRAVLDIGCGGGYLAEAFAADGFQVTGLDPAVNSIRAAQRHAAETGLQIRYEVGRGESLPFADETFDIVCCCDVLEHVDDVGQVLREAARTLKPGGVFLYDTVNRTLRSKLVVIKVCQDWIGFGAPNAHVWEKFLQPDELMELLRAVGLTPGGVRGITAAKRPAALLYGLWKIRRSTIRGAAVADTFALRETSDLGISYMGWARRASSCKRNNP